MPCLTLDSSFHLLEFVVVRCILYGSSFIIFQESPSEYLIMIDAYYQPFHTTNNHHHHPIRSVTNPQINHAS